MRSASNCASTKGPYGNRRSGTAVRAVTSPFTRRPVPRRKSPASSASRAMPIFSQISSVRGLTPSAFTK
jgi:hypothetical protein